MTTSTTTQTVVRSVGRPLTDRARRTKRAVERFLESSQGQFTAADVRKVSKQSKVTVRNRMNALEREGLIKKVKSDAPKEREAVRQNRQFIRVMASKSFEERCAYVADCLTRLYEEQLVDEKRTRDSHHHNGRGFTKYDAPRGTVDAEYILENEVVTVEQVNYWLQPVNKEGRSRIQKYSRQLQALREQETA